MYVHVYILVDISNIYVYIYIYIYIYISNICFFISVLGSCSFWHRKRLGRNCLDF